MRDWNAKLRDELLDLSSKLEKEGKFQDPDYDVFDFYTHALEKRLEYEIPFVMRWNEAMALGILPYNAFTTSVNLSDMIELLLYFSNFNGSSLQKASLKGGLLSAFTATGMCDY